MANIRIGKNVIETLTSGMYEDARFVYREYVQNSADQIDKAVELGVLQNRQAGSIHIRIDYVNREIIIEDNATGIESDRVYSVLGNIALSEKDRTKNKGFRGIGRLGGLGYCDQLIFETSYQGEDIKTEMIWDAKSLQSQLNNHNLHIDAVELVESVIILKKSQIEKDKHFFKITMKNVNNSDLLNDKLIEEYLSIVAPVTFPSHFILKHKIYDKMRKMNMTIDEYNIYINTNQLSKPYSNAIYERFKKNGKKKIDEVFDVEFFDFFYKDEFLAWGWFGLSKLLKQIPNCVDLNINPARGIRLRKGNIQIGSERTLEKFHKEPRGNFYFIGEIYAIHPDLIPNSRRDYFNENEICKVLNKKVKTLFYTKLYSLYYDANAVKNALKKIHSVHQLKKEIEEKESSTGFTDKNEQNKLYEQLKRSKDEAIKGIKTLNKLEEKSKSDNSFKKIYNRYKDDIDNTKLTIEIKGINPEIEQKTVYRTNKLSRLTKKDQKFLSKVFSIIDIVLTPELAENLKIKLEEEFK
ncbi:MAG: ATP-binding protein [Candidatus Cloacimonetes bacterium]|nr:ATP-binding protein [Candidatus Cloacimonadota bacterium]